MKKRKCKHRKIKENYPFGRKSKSRKYCKICGEVITNKMIREMNPKRRRRK